MDGLDHRPASRQRQTDSLGCSQGGTRHRSLVQGHFYLPSPGAYFLTSSPSRGSNQAVKQACWRPRAQRAPLTGSRSRQEEQDSTAPLESQLLPVLAPLRPQKHTFCCFRHTHLISDQQTTPIVLRTHCGNVLQWILRWIRLLVYAAMNHSWFTHSLCDTRVGTVCVCVCVS